MIYHNFIQKKKKTLILILITLSLYDFIGRVNSNNIILIAFVITYYSGIKYLKFTSNITWWILFTISILTGITLALEKTFTTEKLSIWLYLFIIIYFYQTLIQNRNSN